MKTLWYWEATFSDQENPLKIYRSGSIGGFVSRGAALAHFEQSCNNGVICMAGVREGSQLIELELILENKEAT